MKAGHDAVPLGEEEARRVEPRLLLAQLEVVPVQAPCSGCLANARAFRLSHSASSWPGRNVRSVVPAGRRGWSSGAPQRPAHLPQRAEALEAGRPGQPAAAGRSPWAQSRTRCPPASAISSRTQGQAEPVAPVPRVDDQLAADVQAGVPGRVQVRVTGDLLVHGQHQVTPRGRVGAGARRVVAQVQQHVLGERRHRVGGGRGRGQVQDPGHLGRGEPAAGDRPVRHGPQVTAPAPRRGRRSRARCPGLPRRSGPAPRGRARPVRP